MQPDFPTVSVVNYHESRNSITIMFPDGELNYPANIIKDNKNLKNTPFWNFFFQNNGNYSARVMFINLSIAEVKPLLIKKINGGHHNPNEVIDSLFKGKASDNTSLNFPSLNLSTGNGYINSLQ